MRNIIVAIIAAIALCGGRLQAVEGDIHEGLLTRLSIEVENHIGRVHMEADGTGHDVEFNADRITTHPGLLSLTESFQIGTDSLHTAWGSFAIENLRVDSVFTRGKRLIGVVFIQRQTVSPSSRLSSRNRVAAGDELVIEKDDFVRGDAICFGGDIRVTGEINQNAVAIFGDVNVTRGGIVRGEVVSIGGSVDLESGSTVYGEVISQEGTKRSAGRRSNRPGDNWGPNVFQPLVAYNRVDGLFLGAKMAFTDPDSILPTVYASGGYAFTSDKWQHEIGAHQRVFDEYSIGIGGSFFRRTATDDEWLSPQYERTFLSLAAKEDYADYYEEKGGRVYVTFDARLSHQFGISYQFVKLDWLDHHPKLWSIFGGGKEFRANFSSVPAAERRERLSEFDGKLGEMSAWYRFSRTGKVDGATRGWYAELMYTAAGDHLKGDLTYDRVTAEVRRYQPLTRRQSLNLRVKYGFAGTELPLIRSFYLGGSRTIRGLDNKAVRGDQMLLGNLEYVVHFPRPKLEVSFLADCGKVVGSNDNVFSDGDFLSSIGLGFGVTDAIKVNVSKSLNDADEPARIWVILQKSF